MRAALGSLRSYYAARIAAALMTRRGDAGAVLAVLLLERDEALQRLAERLRLERKQAMRDARRATGRRLRIAPSPLRPVLTRRTASRFRHPVSRAHETPSTG
jgi:hypothetical protein